MARSVLVFSPNSLPDPIVYLSEERTSIGRSPGPCIFRFGGAEAARFLCRSCPGYGAQANARYRGANVAQLASGEQYRCKPNQNHVLCQCCLEPIPDRRGDPNAHLVVKCHICSRTFCDQYWAAGCDGLRAGPRCSSCFSKFKDMNFDARDMDGIILNNVFESDIFKTAIRDTAESDINVLLSTCLKRASDGLFKLKYVESADTVVCKDCARKELSELAYQFRVSDVPNDRLPREVTSRDACWWGRNCTTQRKNPDHARRLNHVCEQTRRH
uniref:E3 ubiquitin-protein ligase CHFR cysteine rich domain-containing protein n=1 Tax=Plectus sambesii TaxID=2011161 RepID=A0A914WIL8_9BILA